VVLQQVMISAVVSYKPMIAAWSGWRLNLPRSFLGVGGRTPLTRLLHDRERQGRVTSVRITA
jgi:hypothetical protein